MTVFNFGSINLDYVYRVAHLVQAGETLASDSLDTVLGGKGANQSVALARAGTEVRHIGRLCSADRWAVEQMSDAGVDVNSVEFSAGHSGHAIIQVDDNGENSIILYGGANHEFDRVALEKHLSEASAGDWLLLQNECNCVAEAFDIALQKGMSVAFNPAPMTAAVKSLPLECCSILIVNETEAEALSGVAEADPVMGLAALAVRYPKTRLVLTLGARGVMLYHDGEQYLQEALEIDVVDTTGAGDTFVGYFLAAHIDGLDEQQCLKRACAAAALSVTRPGAVPSIPAAADVDSCLNRASR